MRKAKQYGPMWLGMAAGVAIFLAGCGGDSNSLWATEVVGAWKWASATVTSPAVTNGTITVTPDVVAMFGPASMTLNLDASGHGTLQATVPALLNLTQGGAVKAEGRWTKTATKLTVTVQRVTGNGGLLDGVQAGQSFTVPYTVNGNTLSLSLTEQVLQTPGTSARVVFTRP